MLAFSEQGDNAKVDMLVGDIYGQDYSKLGLKSTMIASSFGKVFKKGGEKETFSPEDISKSLLYAVSNNIGQIAYMNAEKYNLDRIYFGGCFIRGTRHIVMCCVELICLCCRACGYDYDVVLRDPLLEQRDQACHVPAPRRISGVDWGMDTEY